MTDHSRAVTRHFLNAENTLEEGYWDDAMREVDYFEEQDEPHATPRNKGRMVGEFDVLLLNYDDQIALYKEIKTSRGDLYKAERQIERAENFFEDTEWDVYGTSILE